MAFIHKIALIQLLAAAVGIADTDELLPQAAIPPAETAILVHGSAGIEASGGGVQILRYRDNPGGWTFPSLIDIEASSPRGRNGLTGSFAMFVPGVCAFKRPFGNGLCLLVSAGIPLGLETTTDASGNRDTRFFVGANAGQSLALMPLNKMGLVLDAGFYESALLNSKLYPWDLGAKLGAGFQF